MSIRASNYFCGAVGFVCAVFLFRNGAGQEWLHHKTKVIDLSLSLIVRPEKSLSCRGLSAQKIKNAFSTGFVVTQKNESRETTQYFFSKTICPLVKNGLSEFLLTTKKAQ
jgi:hypothetical protein